MTRENTESRPCSSNVWSPAVTRSEPASGSTNSSEPPVSTVCGSPGASRSTRSPVQSQPGVLGRDLDDRAGATAVVRLAEKAHGSSPAARSTAAAASTAANTSPSGG